MRSTIGRAALVSVLCLLGAAGCDELKLPFPVETDPGDTGTAPAKESDTVRPANAAKTEHSSNAGVVDTPQPPAKPTAESVLAALTAKVSIHVTDKDLKKFSGVESGLEIVTDLNLFGAQLTDAGLKMLAALPALKKLNLEEARIHPSYWGGLADITALESLSLRKTSIDNSTLSAVSAMTNLKSLNISKTRVTDQGFVHLQGLSSLEELAISELNIEGSGMEALGKKGARAPL